MNKAVNEIAISFFKKSLEECSSGELQRLTAQYPYFGPLELLLAKKLQEENSPLYEEQVQKASLYFQNRLWLDLLLNNGHNSGSIKPNETVNEEKIAYNEEQSGPVAEPGVEISQEPVKEETVEPLLGIPNIEVRQVVEPLKQEEDEEPEPDEEGMNEQSDTPFQMPALKIDPNTPGIELTFEPYHTVDYFASQGIKVKEDEKQGDRFSQQLKSFTEWLKAMKKIPGAESNLAADPTREKKVEQMAEYSIAERHVVTEAMAEVWIKQGNKARAEEIYRKLSLLEPLKTAYFAAKIEELKKTS